MAKELISLTGDDLIDNVYRAWQRELTRQVSLDEIAAFLAGAQMTKRQLEHQAAAWAVASSALNKVGRS